MQGIIADINHKLLCRYEGILPGLHTFLNPFSYSRLRKTGFLQQMDTISCDGILLVYLLRILGIKKVQRLSFDMTSIAAAVFKEASEKKFSIQIIGGPPGAVECMVKNARSQYPGINIIGIRHGYFGDGTERASYIKFLKNKNPDIVIAGLGAGVQEKFLIDLKTAGWKGSGYTCGGFIHQAAQRLHYYPIWAEKYHIRWLYRIIDEPKLFKRYFYEYPVGIIELIKDTIEFHLHCQKVNK